MTPSPIRRDRLDRLADALVEDILATPGAELLAETAEDYRDPHALSTEFEKIIEPFMGTFAVQDNAAGPGERVLPNAALGGSDGNSNEVRRDAHSRRLRWILRTRPRVQTLGNGSEQIASRGPVSQAFQRLAELCRGLQMDGSRFPRSVRVAMVSLLIFVGIIGVAALHWVNQMPTSFVDEFTRAADPIVNPDAVPLRWSGLFLNTDAQIDDKKYDIKCTAQFVSPRVVLTAAHCIQDYRAGIWYDIERMYFLLQYQNGRFAEVYRPVCLSRFDGWFSNTDATQSGAERALESRYQWDYEMMLVDHDGPADYFNRAVDWSGKYLNATMIGYTSAPSEKQAIQTAFGSLDFVSDRPNVVALTHRDHPDLTRGASGGAWISAFNKEVSAANNIIVSVSSYVNPRSPGVSFGPYLTADFDRLFDYVSKRCPTTPQGVGAEPYTTVLGVERASSVSRVATKGFGLSREELIRAAHDSVPIIMIPSDLPRERKVK